MDRLEKEIEKLKKLLRERPTTTTTTLDASGVILNPGVKTVGKIRNFAPAVPSVTNPPVWTARFE
jgi:hypothetical protein